MHITILTIGSRGDVQPIVALGAGLRHAGHTVRLATHADFELLVRTNGLEFAPLEGNAQAIIGSPEGQAWLETARNPIAFFRGFRQLMGSVVRQGMQDALRACEGTELIIFAGPAFYIAQSVAEKLKLPFIQAYLQPMHPTSEFPSALFPSPFGSGRVFNYLSHVMGGQGFWQLMRPVVNEARRAFLELPPLSIFGPFPEMNRRQLPVLYGYSPAVLPKPRKWGEYLHVTGYWFLDNPEWTPPASLTDFLAAGPAPVYIGFGSMVDRDPQRMTETVLRALKQSGQRGILQRGWGGLRPADLPEEILMIDDVPHSWLFPHMAAVVHHGGAGTTAAGLRAGMPSILIPFFGDQPFWAQRVEQLGVGNGSLQRKQLTAEQLAQAITNAVSDGELRARAAQLGQSIRAEDGVGTATAIVERAIRQPMAHGVQAFLPRAAQ